MNGLGRSIHRRGLAGVQVRKNKSLPASEDVHQDVENGENSASSTSMNSKGEEKHPQRGDYRSNMYKKHLFPLSSTDGSQVQLLSHPFRAHFTS